jgi:hypothetical protein
MSCWSEENPDPLPPVSGWHITFGARAVREVRKRGLTSAASLVCLAAAIFGLLKQ